MYDPDPVKHDESVKKYPTLNLSEGEFVIEDVRRHPIGLFSIWFVAILVVVLVLAISIFIGSHASDLTASGVALAPDQILIGMALVTILVLLLAWVGQIIYTDNRFYVTNESVIQHIRTGLFASREQSISLGGIEDASFHQDGILQYLLGYGSIRLSTVGDETTYRFTIVANPKPQLDALNNAVEAFKRNHMYEGMNQPAAAAPSEPVAQPPTDKSA